jgi:DNA-binding response OmpR family regulator
MSTAATDFKVATLEAKVRELNGTIDEQREEIRQLREALAPDDFVLPGWAPHLTKTERALLALLVTGRFVSYERALNALYWDRDDRPAGNIVAVYLHKLRTKFGDKFVVNITYGQGMQMAPETVAMFKPKAEAA